MKLALVTAGMRRIGAAIAARLASDGWALALHSRQDSAPDADLAAIIQVHQTPWHGFVADFADGDQVSGLLPHIAAHFGRMPDLIVNNASCFAWDDPATVTADALAHHHAINVTAPVLLATGLAGALPSAARACVVNILDQRIRHAGGDQLSYTLSKQALGVATETLARALAPKLRVNAVAPGLTLPTDDYRPAQMVRLAAMMPLARLPDPDEIADAVVWLADAEAVTGQTIFVDGGASLKQFDRDFVFMGDDEI
jgi:pteridine reductase